MLEVFGGADGVHPNVIRLAVRAMPTSGKPADMMDAAGISAPHIVDAVRAGGQEVSHGAPRQGMKERVSDQAYAWPARLFNTYSRNMPKNLPWDRIKGFCLREVRLLLSHIFRFRVGLLRRPLFSERTSM